MSHENIIKSPPNFNTQVDKVSKRSAWPQGSDEEKLKRRSVSQQFKRESNNGFRLTFMNHPGQKCTVPMRSAIRAEDRCHQCHGSLASIPEAPVNFKARNMPNTKQFVLKAPVHNITVPRPPSLMTNERSKMREIYAKRAEDYRRKILKEREEALKKRMKDKTPTFNTNF